MQYNSGYNDNIYSFVNNINTHDGGTHEEGVRRALTRVINSYAKKNNILKEKDDSLTGDDVKEGLTMIISCKHPNPQFEGQTKEKLGNSDIRTLVEKVVNEKLEVFFEENPAIVKEIFDKCLTAARAREAAKRARQAAIKAAQVAKAVAIKTAKAVAAIGKAIASAVAKAAAAFFAAFGWIGVAVVLVILIVIIIVAAIAGSPFGIFISDEAADSNSIPVSSIVNECNMELSARLTEIEDNTTHDRIVMEGEQADWSLVLSLFSVKVAGVDDETVQDVVVIDDAKKQKKDYILYIVFIYYLIINRVIS